MREFFLILTFIALFFTIDAHADCTEDNWDAYKVGKALQQGLSKADLLAHLEASRAELTEERMEKIRVWIDDAYKLDPSQAEIWWQFHHKECPKEDEA